MKDLPIKEIGSIKIYKGQKLASNDIEEEILTGDKIPLLITQPQEGKTGTIIDYTNEWINKNKAQNKSWAVERVINLPDNGIRDQEYKRWTEAGFDVTEDQINRKPNYILIMHHGNLNQCIDISVDAKLILDDECSYALSKPNGKSGKPLFDYLKRNGVKFGFAKTTWESKHVELICSSATPYAQKIVEKLEGFLKK